MGRNILKKYIVIVMICIVLIFCVKKTVHNTQDEAAEIVEENCETTDFELTYQLLNQELFGKDAIQWLDDSLKQEIFQYSEEVKGEFVEVQNKESMFPAELINLLEKMIYQSLDSSLRKFSWEELQKSIYFKTIEELGGENFELDLEEMKNIFSSVKEIAEVEDVYDAYKLVSGEINCQNIFHFHMTDKQDNYVFVIGSGGSGGVVSVRLTERINDEFIVISEFQTQNSGSGMVIQFNDDFYYIFLEYNYVLKNYDGVRIYKLGDNAEQENLKIKYLPYNYMWKNIYNTPKGAELDTYLESIREDITSDRFLENGKAEGAAVYYGDEEKAQGFIIPENCEKYWDNEYYWIDFANIGVPVYMRKSEFIPSNYNTKWHLKSSFYIQNPKDNSISELDKLEIGYSVSIPNEVALVQMWFKESGKSVYTCCLYHVSDYNYVLNIVLLEGDEITRIRTDMICPQRSFTLTEGEVYYY